MLFPPTLDGEEVFGIAVSMQMVPTPTAQQLAEFFGVNGLFQSFGGSRGRTFMVEGSLIGEDIPALNALESDLLSFADGVGRQLSDTRGRTWPSVVFRNEYQADPHGPRPATWFDGDDLVGGWALRYKLVLHGLQ